MAANSKVGKNSWRTQYLVCFRVTRTIGNCCQITTLFSSSFCRTHPSTYTCSTTWCEARSWERAESLDRAEWWKSPSWGVLRWARSRQWWHTIHPPASTAWARRVGGSSGWAREWQYWLTTGRGARRQSAMWAPIHIPYLVDFVLPAAKQVIERQELLGDKLGSPATLDPLVITVVIFAAMTACRKNKIFLYSWLHFSLRQGVRIPP